MLSFDTRRIKKSSKRFSIKGPPLDRDGQCRTTVQPQLLFSNLPLEESGKQSIFLHLYLIIFVFFLKLMFYQFTQTEKLLRYLYEMVNSIRHP